MLRPLVTLTLLWLPCAVYAADRPAARVLFIGIDGCRGDAVKSLKLPNLHALIDGGAFSEQTNILGSRGDKANTASGPGWSNLLTGVWPDKHGVMDNDFKVMHYDRYPHFFQHLKEQFPKAQTYSYSDWPPIAEKIVSAADKAENFEGTDSDAIKKYLQADELAVDAAVDTLTQADPDAVFCYLGQVDETGHKKGFHPTVAEYATALERVDGLVGRMVKAVQARPHYAEENWLVLVGTDHGGKGTGHGGGREVPEINTVWLIVSGPAAQPGTIDGPTNQVDLVATALTHLGATPRPEWELDGRAVGLKQKPATTPAKN